jgi:alpha-mannosidase
LPLLTLQKLSKRIPEIIAAAIRETVLVENVRTCAAPGLCADNAMAAPPLPDADDWRTLRLYEMWGAPPGVDPVEPPKALMWGMPLDGGSNHWLHAKLRVPATWRGKQVLVSMTWQGTNQSSLEAIAYLDGQTFSGFDQFHQSMVLPASAHDGEHDFLVRCYLPYAKSFEGLKLQLRDEVIFRLGHVMRTLLDAIQRYRESDPTYHALLERLNAAYNRLDLREGWQSKSFADSAHAALAVLLEHLTDGLDSGPRPTIVSTGHAHLDIEWLWPLWRCYQKVAHTVANALHLMERYPDYTFSLSQPQVFAYLKRDAPDLYAKLKERAAEGRFEPIGMMWVEPDCNIPSGESIVRQLLHGARFFAEEFGVLNHVVWLPDVFGYSAALPQLMRLCGVKCFMTTKISWNQFNRMPYDTFRWRGIDGTDVLTHFVTATDQPVKHPAEAQFYTYNGNMTAGQVFGTWEHYRQKEISQELLYIYGHGDGGGGPTEEMLETAQLLKDLPGFPQVKMGKVDQFFEDLYRRAWDDPRLPTWVGELYLEFHRGTYTSQSRNKQANRASELLYREAEWLNAWTSSQLGAANQQEELNKGWELILLNQFHDILPGSSVPLVYADSNENYAKAREVAEEVRENALTQIVGQVGGDLPVVFNTLPWDRRDVVELPQGRTPQDAVTQVTENGVLVEVEVPSYGYSVLNATAASSSLIVEQDRLENGELRLELDDQGEITSLYDLRHDREIIAPDKTGNQLVAYEDRPMNWDAWDIDIFYEEKPYPIQGIVDWRVVEAGPLRAAIEIVRRYGQSTIKQRICMWHDKRRIDFVTEVDWHERQTLLRTLFPLNINASQAMCEIQFGAVERPTHRNTSWDWARFEVCAHRWVDLSEGGYGVALLNDGKYGHSLHNNVIGLSLLKGGIHPDPEADRGTHRFTYSLFPHEGDWRAGEVTRRAYELNVPLRAVMPSGGSPAEEAALPASYSFLSTPTDHVIVETIKAAEDGGGLIVRLYEAHNRRGPVSLIFGRPVRSAVEVDLLERPIERSAVNVEGSQVWFAIRPFEVKTLRVELA